MDWQKLVEQLIQLVETTSKNLWEIAFKQVYARTTADLLLSVILLVFIFIFIVRIKSRIVLAQKKKEETKENYNQYNYWEDESTPSILLDIFSGVLAVIFVIVIISNVYSSTLCLINPGYCALEIIINLVK